MRRVGEIENFRPELSLPSFPDSELPRQATIVVKRTGSAHSAEHFCAKANGSHGSKRQGVEIGLVGASAANDVDCRLHQVRALRVAGGVKRGAGSGDVERLSGVGANETVQLPSAG